MPLSQDDPSWPAFQAFVEKYNKRYNSVSETRGKFSPSAADFLHGGVRRLRPT